MSGPDFDPVLAERIEARAWLDMYSAAAPLATAQRFGDIVARAVAAAPRARPLNGLLDVGDADLDHLEVALAFMDATGVDYNVSVRAGTDAERALLDRGMQPGYAWMKFGIDLGSAKLEPPGPGDVEVRRAGPEDGEAFGAVLAAGFELPSALAGLARNLPERPRWHCFLGLSHGEPVATGALFVADGIAWIGAGATRPDKRRLGAQSAILAARLRAARDLGCRAAFTETGERVEGKPDASYRNILRAGFGERYLRPNLVVPVRGLHTQSP
ncbi:MAG: hypothetical protein HYZ29_00310 [Myxococcales bacterium]|nr:hypothetical protein [Myxococcales bacterium]